MDIIVLKNSILSLKEREMLFRLLTRKSRNIIKPQYIYNGKLYYDIQQTDHNVETLWKCLRIKKRTSMLYIFKSSFGNIFGGYVAAEQLAHYDYSCQDDKAFLFVLKSDINKQEAEIFHINADDKNNAFSFDYIYEDPESEKYVGRFVFKWGGKERWYNGGKYDCALYIPQGIGPYFFPAFCNEYKGYNLPSGNILMVVMIL